MTPDHILGFIVGMIAATVIFMAYSRSDVAEPEQDLCPHGDDWDYCPICCH